MIKIKQSSGVCYLKALYFVFEFFTSATLEGARYNFVKTKFRPSSIIGMSL